MMTMGQIILTVTLSMVRVFKSATYFHLALFIIANGVIALGPVMSSLPPKSYTLYIAFVFPALFLLPPSLWLYVEGLTSIKPWRLQVKHLRQYTLVGFGIIITLLILSLPEAVRHAIFIEGTDVESGSATTVVISVLLAVIVWAGQCIYTAFRIIYRLINYRKQLKDLFSNNEQRDLNWLNWFLTFAITVWLISFISLLSSSLLEDSFFNQRVEASLSLILVWCLAHFGLQQKRGLFEQPLEVEPIDNAQSKVSEKKVIIESIPTKKYQRSALSKEQAERIAEKINLAMAQDKHYLDASLSLHKLAKLVAISPNYISQTLNETLKMNFFDFVNQWRIEAAKPKIMANKDTVLHIALDVGFNARSSFYKAFKQETGLTPSEFRSKS
jgi:AraC-like DNA-binding protein